MIHSNDLDYFGLLLKSNLQGISALEYLVDDLHENKSRTVNAFLNHAGSEDFLWALVKFIGNDNARIAGNAAYILGTIAESEMGRHRVISLTESRHSERKRILPDLVNLLVSADTESVMNAAGTIGTLAESDEGRNWLLRESCNQIMLERITGLLSNENAWTASNAALVLARLTIAEKGCELLLENELSKLILTQLINSLGTDEAGRGMNAAFAVGRLCDISLGRKLLLSMPEANKMVTQLVSMLCSDDGGCSKNACFAISCLATSAEGHDKLLNSATCDRTMTTLAHLLSSNDYETGWFAAMTLRTFASRPRGCMKLRELPKIVSLLQQAVKCCLDNEEMLKEVEETLAILEYLPKAPTPTAVVLGPREVHVSWEKVETKCGLPVSYKILDDQNCVYSGSDLEATLTDLSPSTTLNLRLRACTTGDDSPFSDCVTVMTDEDLPEEPSDLKQLAHTSTQLKIGWQPPVSYAGAIKAYSVYLDASHYVNTTELSCIISGLKESTTYQIEVCASTSKGKGPKATAACITASMGDHCPSKPLLSILGRNEINVSWNPPPVPLGRITRYDVAMNGRVIYSGTDLHCTARQLTPNTEYIFIVTVITNEGPQDSKPSKRRTAKDEFDVQRTPLYHIPVKRDESNLENNASGRQRRKRPVTVNKPSGNKTQTVRNRILPKRNNASAEPTLERSHTVAGVRSGGDLPTLHPRSREGHWGYVKSDGRKFRNKLTSAQNKSASQNSEQSDVLCSTAELDIHFEAQPIVNFIPDFENPPANKAGCEPKTSLQLSKDYLPMSPDQEKLSRGLTKLSVSTFEPMLPPSSVQRSATFVGQKRTNQLYRGSHHSNFSGPPISSTVGFDSALNMALQNKTGSRFFPMQFRTQPNNLPNTHWL